MKRLFAWFLFFCVLVFNPAVTVAGSFGIGIYLTSEPYKETIANMASEIGVDITRSEFIYSDNIDWAPYDEGINLAYARGIENLILLHVSDSSNLPSLSEWESFVNQVSSRYVGKVSGYEILNEADNYISASSYKDYLWTSYDKIKANDSSAKIVVSGLTARSEASNFWQGLYDAGAWDKFDAIGLHPYRDNSPEVVGYGLGDFTSTVGLAVNFIRSHGGGKTVWLTEFGVRSAQVGEQNQSNYIARSYVMAKAWPEVEKVMMYRFRNDEGGWGVVNPDLSQKTIYGKYRDFISQVSDLGTGERVYLYDQDVIDDFDYAPSGYSTDQTNNGSVTINSDTGQSGGGMRMDYQFNGDGAYAVAQKEVSMERNPSGIGGWFKGNPNNNVIRLRIVDNEGEVFQFDMGTAPSDWTFYRFDFETDEGIGSYGGNGSIDYPIRFDSVLYNYQGDGDTSGSLYIDGLTSIKSGSQLYAYKFGSKLAYWSSEGEESTTACGKELTFYEEPQLTDVTSCDGWENQASEEETSSDTTTTTSNNTVSSYTPITYSKDSPNIVFNKDEVKANGEDKLEVIIDIGSDEIGDTEIEVEVSGDKNNISEIKQNGDDFVFEITSKKAEEKEVKINFDGEEKGKKNIKFVVGSIEVVESWVKTNNWTPDVEEEIELELVLTDKNGNIVSMDGNENRDWKIKIIEGEGEVTLATQDSGWKAKLKSSTAGKKVLKASYGGYEVDAQTVIYYQENNDSGTEFAREVDIKKGEDFQIVGESGEKIKINFENLDKSDKTIFQLGENNYYALNWDEGEGYSIILTLGEDPGKENAKTYSESVKGVQIEFSKGTVEVKSSILLISLVALAICSILTIVFLAVLFVPRFRLEFGKRAIDLFEKIKMVFGKKKGEYEE